MRPIRLASLLFAALLPWAVPSYADGKAFIAEFGGGLHTDQAKTAVTVEPNSYVSYYIDLPSNVASFTTRTTGSGNVDLFVRPAYPHDATSQQGLIDQSAGFSAGPSADETVVLQRASSTLSSGRWWLTVLNPGSTGITIDLTVDIATQGAAFVPSIGQSGTWYDPAKSQQGLFVQYLSAAQVFVAWFTYEPDGKQAYLFGIGVIEGDRIEIETLSRTRGTRFGIGFNPADVVSEDWGDLTITLNSCTTGFADFLPSRVGWPIEQLRIQQLTAVPGLTCTGTAKQEKANEKYLGSSISGSWYDPTRSGEGFLVQALNAQLAVLYWFTFDPQGNQAWFGGVGEIVDGSIFLRDATRPVGGRFGPGYSSSQVTASPWGAIGMTLKDCTHAVLQSVGPDTSWNSQGSDNLQRLTGVAGLPDCNLGATPLRLSGAIQPVPLAYQDGDSNNTDSSNLDNDGFAQAQTIGNPAIVSGFAAKAATSEPGDRFSGSTDEFDVYRMTVTAGQSIQLLISDWTAATSQTLDFDLYLYRTGETAQPLQSALGYDKNEFITVPATGSYDLVVQAYAGRGNYVLAVSNAPVPPQAKSLSLENRFVPDEIVVRFDEVWDDDNAPKALYKSISQREAKLGGLEFQRGEPGRPQLWRLPTHNRAAVLKALGANVADAKSSAAGVLTMSAEQRERYELLLAIKALAGRADVRYAEPNYLAEALGTTTAKAVPNDPRYREQWHYPMINLPQAWDITQGSADVVVAVIDSGVNPHPDLAANIRPDLGFDTIVSSLRACDGSGADRDATDPGDGCGSPAEDSFHGTHVAGTIAALNNNGRGVAGVAPQTKVMPVRVLGKGPGPIKDIADGIAWAAGESLVGVRASRAADVINLSLGGGGPCPQFFQEAIAIARAKGISVVAAAGNENSFGPSSPADCPGVLKVAAVNRNGLPAHYSNCRDIDIAAPGGETQPDPIGSQLYPLLNPQACKGPLGSNAQHNDGILSTLSVRGNPTAEKYDFYQGTSMAAPHVAGVIALMKAAHPGLTANDVDALLAAGKMTIGRDVLAPTAPQDQFRYFYGYGILDALSAVRAAKELAGAGAALPPATVVAQPTSLDFGDTTQTLALTLSKVGSGAAGIQSLQDNVSWLSGSGGGPEGLGQYTITVNRSDLPNGEHNGIIRASTSAGSNLDIPVRMRVGTPPSFGESGAIYALLLDALTFQTVAATSALLPQSGRATFSFPSILPGSYYLLYSTDNDNDFFVCDAGEYCGFFPFGDNAGPLELSGTNLDIGIVPLVPDISGLGEANSNAASKRLPPSVLNAAKRKSKP